MNSGSNWFSDNEQDLPPKKSVPPWKPVVSIGIVLFVAAFGVWLYLQPADAERRTPVAEVVQKDAMSANVLQAPSVALAEARPISVASDGYVGSEACQACHQHEHATWYDSFHRTMTQVGTPDSIVGNFNEIELQRGNRRFRLGHNEESFWVKLEDPAAGPNRPARELTRNVMLCTGSHHLQVYWL